MASPSPYRFVRKLGSGASGVVWAAEREGRLVAVKVLRTSGNAAHAEAIRREMRLGPLIASHPGLVGVRRVEEVDGVLHLEMDVVEGPSLAQILRGRVLDGSGALPSSVAVVFATQVLDALRWASQAVAPHYPASFVHRDVKPANLLLDPSGRLRVTDFGIARAQVELGFQTTATGVVKGSPRYMAPEIILEKAPDARADQFSVGVVLFEMLTAAPLYVGKDVTEVLMLAVQAEVWRRLPLVSGPPALVDVLRRMLSKEPTQRYADHAAAIAALQALDVAGPTIGEVLPSLLAYGAPEEEPPIAEETGEVTAPVVETEAQTDPHLVPHANPTLSFLGPPGKTVQGSLHTAALSTLNPETGDVPTRPGVDVDEVGGFAEPDETTDVTGLDEATPGALASASAKRVPAIPPPPRAGPPPAAPASRDRAITPPTSPGRISPALGDRAPQPLSYEAPTEILRGPTLEEQLAALDRAQASEAPTQVLDRQEVLQDLGAPSAPAPGRAERRSARRTQEQWLLVLALLAVLLGIGAAVAIVIAALATA